MDDSVASDAWTIAPEARAAVLLEEARRALRSGDPETAVAWAEEVLEDDPDDVDALRVVADGAPRYGHAEVGVLAARQLARRGHDPGVLLAAALLAACDVEAAQAEAERVLVANPRDARAHAVFGQCRELLGAEDEAAAALDRARSLDPSRYPPAFTIDPADWPPLVDEASAALSDADRAALATFSLILSPIPALADLRSVTPPASPSTTALLLDRPGSPPVVHIYQHNLCRVVESRRGAVDELVTALSHELRAWRREP